jgi:aminopeptidase YwaD
MVTHFLNWFLPMSENMFKKIVALVFLVFTFHSFLFSQYEAEKEVIKTLCSPAFHGRGYVNSGDSIAAELIASELQKRGAKMYGSSFFQTFQFPVNCFPAKVEAKLNEQILLPGTDFMVDPGSCGFTGKLQALYFPFALYFDANARNEFFKRDLSASILVFPSTKIKGDSAKQIAAIVSNLKTRYPSVQLYDTKFTWSVADKQSEKLQLWLQTSKWDVYNAMLDSKSSEFEIDVAAQLQTNHVARNVIAYFPAKKKRAKTIIFSAHYDHLGRMGENAYFPGANDNASGVGQLLNLAKYYASHPSKFNIVFIAFAGEEAGLLGSEFYVSNPLFPLSKIRFLLNLDIMGSGEEGITVVNGSVFKKEFDLLQKINDEKHHLAQIKIRGKAANSDHYFFSEAGVPSFFFYTMGPNKNYHDIEDRYEALSFAKYNEITALAIDFVDNLKKKR